MTTTATSSEPRIAPQAAESTVLVQTEAVRRPNTIGLVALGLAILGFLLAIFLITAGLAWMLLIPAIALAIVGLILPNRRRGVAVAALVIGVIGLLLSFVGFRLPVGTVAGSEVLNNDGVNPFSVFAGPLPGQTIAGLPGTGTATATTADGVTVSVGEVDCHQPIASVTGLNITGEVCAITLTATNNGTELVTIDSSSVTALADGASILAQVDVAEGPVLDAQLLPGDSSTGLIYVNVPNGATLDGLSVSAGTDDSDLVNLDLGGLNIGG